MTDNAVPVEGTDLDFWYCLVDERVAAVFIDVVPRTMQGWRQKGDGPKFVRVSKRCVKYRRIDLKQYADERLRASTSDPGPEPVGDQDRAPLAIPESSDRWKPEKAKGEDGVVHDPPRQ